MEAIRKRRGFTKGSVNMSLYRVPKPKPPIPSGNDNNHITTNSNSDANVGFIVNRDYVTPQPPKHKIAVAPPEYDSCKKFENFYGVVADESVDIKAAIYISSVQERFKLEQINY